LIFWVQESNLLIDYLAKGQNINAEYYWSLLVQLKDILKDKRRGNSPRVSCSCMITHRLTGDLQPRGNCPTWLSNVLITHPILRIWPLFPGLKKQLRCRHFSFDADVVAAAEI
jgi:hypothetical protein